MSTKYTAGLIDILLNNMSPCDNLIYHDMYSMDWKLIHMSPAARKLGMGIELPM